MSPAATQAAAKSAQPKTNDWPGLALRSIVVAAAACAGAWLSLTGLRTPAPRPAIATEFSAVRAADRARALLGDQPRPVGSTANAAAVERLASWLRARKMEVEVQEATVRAGGRNVMLRNIIARRTGALPGKAVMIVAHHDTVAASPGAGDDGMGVAIALEVADALNVDPWKGRDVIVLLTDGEEAGLLGAKHFAENHRWMADVGCVLNIDHRGNAGPCLLYETGPDTARVLEPVAPLLGPVVANSTFAEISRHMPNTTDFRVFRERGVPGLNFAVDDGFAHYHQPSDTWANADLSSLQHQGDMVLPAMHALSTAKEDRHKIEGDAVFLDVAGAFLAWWPARAGVVAGIACTLVTCALGWLGARRNNMPKPMLASGFAASMVRAIVASGFTWLTLWALARGGAFGMEAATAAMPDASMFARYR
ncbi:MAG: M28 family peptidase, partial [Planctomycetes bacterium]|nr:M28 family peptidase [Planctomycetota bacterium]